MMLNESEIQDLQRMFSKEDTPRLYEASRALARLVNWTNQCSDGWPFWRKPSQASINLQDRLRLAEDARRRRGAVDDITKDEWSRLFRPIRQFLGDQKVEDPDMVLFPPPPPESVPPVERWVYLAGDAEGPDLHGIVYEDLDPASDCAVENDGVVWKVKALLVPGTAEKVWEV